MHGELLWEAYAPLPAKGNDDDNDDDVTPSQYQGLWQWCKMVEVNGAYKHGRYEKIWLKNLHVNVQC